MSILSELKTKEVSVGTIVLLLLFALANPFDLYMLSMGGMIALALLVGAFMVFAAFVWGDASAGDEREAAHQALVGRFAYLSGASTLLIGVIFQSLNDILDPMLVVALGVMVLAKIFGTAYVRARY